MFLAMNETQKSLGGNRRCVHKLFNPNKQKSSKLVEGGLLEMIAHGTAKQFTEKWGVANKSYVNDEGIGSQSSQGVLTKITKQIKMIEILSKI